MNASMRALIAHMHQRSDSITYFDALVYKAMVDVLKGKHLCTLTDVSEVMGTSLRSVHQSVIRLHRAGLVLIGVDSNDEMGFIFIFPNDE